jgi:CRP-like cAMP-binding protein
MGQLTDLDVEWMAKAGVRRRLTTGTPLIHEGKPVASIFIVLEGEVLVTNAAGTTNVRLGSGEIVGEMSFVDASPPSATVAALGDVVVLQIPREHLEERLRQDTGFAARFYRAVAIFLSDRLRSFTGATGSVPAAEGVLEQDELDPNVLDTVALAGDRFSQMLRKLGSARLMD